MTVAVHHQWQAFLEECAGGDLDQALSFAGFEAAAQLPSLSALAATLGGLVEGRDNLPARANLELIAQRLLLGRHPVLLGRFRCLWAGHGTPDSVIDDAVQATQAALRDWPGGSLGPGDWTRPRP